MKLQHLKLKETESLLKRNTLQPLLSALEVIIKYVWCQEDPLWQQMNFIFTEIVFLEVFMEGEGNCLTLT
jgi:hypothetical protein